MSSPSAICFNVRLARWTATPIALAKAAWPGVQLQAFGCSAFPRPRIAPSLHFSEAEVGLIDRNRRSIFSLANKSTQVLWHTFTEPVDTTVRTFPGTTH